MSVRERLESRRAHAQAQAQSRETEAQPATSGASGSVSSLADQFAAACEQVRRSIISEIEPLKTIADRDAARDEINSKLLEMRGRVLKQQQELARLSLTLPLFTRRQATDTLNATLAAIERARNSLLEVGRFRFIRRPTPAAQEAKGSGVSSESSASSTSKSEVKSNVVVSPTIANITRKIVYYVEPSRIPQLVKETCGVELSEGEATRIYRGTARTGSGVPAWVKKYLFDSESGATMSDVDIAACEFPIEIHPSTEIGTDIWVSALDTAILIILAPLNAVRANLLRNSVVILGPVGGSVHIEEAVNSAVVVACRQIRIHLARRVDFMLSTMSRPIIEHSGPTSFAPYPLRYPGLSQDVEQTKIFITPAPSDFSTFIAPESFDEITTTPGSAGPVSSTDDDADEGDWQKVDDFNWLRQTQSPNWCIVPKDQRLKWVHLPRAL